MNGFTIDFATKSKQLLSRFHHEIGKKFPRPGAQLAYVDLFFAGALRRSYALCRAFFDLILVENFTAAAPLIRLQLDTYLRTRAVSLVSDPQRFFEAIVTGTQLNHIKDSAGKRLTDTYLCERLGEGQPWVRELYRETSAFVHFSDKHALASLAGKDRNSFTYGVCDAEEGVPDEAYDQAIVHFVRITNEVLQTFDICAEAAASVLTPSVATIAGPHPEG
ncbi:MAG TPA: hypothetical protein VNN25_12850 [Thermoanaerobaculia bacterium]|nr:hypothetical protein [Thermoanaerobaculia bacterium]